MIRVLRLLFISAVLIGLIAGGCVLRLPTATPGNGVLNLSGIDPITLDPAVANEATSHEFLSQIFSGLLRTGPNLELLPDIATSLPEVSADGTTYTFRLRQNIKFHSGQSLTAADFKYSWERAANPATGSTTAATYLGDIVGVGDVISGRTNEIGGVRVIDDFTLEVRIDSPKSYFLYKMTYPTSYAVDRTNVAQGATWWNHPSGTGPFKLKEWKRNESLTLERNSRYYGSEPHLSQVRYQFYTGLPMDLYETGRIDIAGVAPAYIDKVNDPSGPFHNELVVSPEFSFSYLGFNTRKPPFDDAGVRQAFNLAADKDKIISLIYRNLVQKAAGVVPPGLPGYSSNITGIPYDVNAAKQALASSRYGSVGSLPPITLTTSGYAGGISPVLEALIYQWKQNLGIEVKVRQLEPERFFYNTAGEVDEMFDIGGWLADYAHPQDFVDILFHSGSDNNFGGYSNAEVDRLIEEANREPNQDRSFGLYARAEQIIAQDAACIPLAFGKSYVLVKPYVKGYAVNPQGITRLDSISVLPH